LGKLLKTQLQYQLGLSTEKTLISWSPPEALDNYSLDLLYDQGESPVVIKNKYKVIRNFKPNGYCFTNFKKS
jgi:hypothetical protein